jgi:Sec-independent protein translocase protein TatA
MSIGIGQVLIILLLGILLFGNAPKVIKDLGKGLGAGILEVRKAVKDEAESKQPVNSETITSDSKKLESNTESQKIESSKVESK